MRNGNGGGGLYAYQVMFLLEGLLTLVVAITTFWWLPLGPRSAWWLQQGDREWAEKRVLLDRAGVDQEGEHRRGLAGSEEEEGEELLRDGEEEEVDVIVAKSTVGGEGALTRRDVEEAFRDWKIWWILVVNIASAVPGAAFSIFLPLVIKVSPPKLFVSSTFSVSFIQCPLRSVRSYFIPTTNTPRVWATHPSPPTSLPSRPSSVAPSPSGV